MLIERPKYLSAIEKSVKAVPVTVLVGARQVGKTSLLKLYVRNQKNYLWLDGQLPDTQLAFGSYNSALQFLKLHLNDSVTGLVVIDEFHFIPEISSILKALVDNHPGLKFLCSGSSSIEIFSQIQESLAGRIRFINVFSLSFEEYLKFLDDSLFQEYQKYDLNTEFEVIRTEIKQAFEDFLLYGGLPAVVLAREVEEKIQRLYDIYSTYLLKDVKHFVKFEDSVRFNKLISLLAVQTANLLNISNLSKDCSLPYHRTREYVSLLEQMFIIKLVSPFYVNRQNVVKKIPKVFFLDLGLRNILVKDFRSLDVRQDKGALYENFVFLELLKNLPDYAEIYFYRTKDKAEVDFIIRDMHKTLAIEVKSRNFEKPIRIKALDSLNSLIKPDVLYVINHNLNVQNGDYHYLPAILTRKLFE